MLKGAMAGMMQKAQKMQQDIQDAKAEVKNLNVTSTNNAVQITMNGEHQLSRIVIREEFMNDKALLEDLILNAVNDASSQISQQTKEKMKNISAGLDLPFNLLP